MKKLLYLLVLGCVLFASCSKKGEAGPAPHTIKVTVTGSDAFTATVSVIKSNMTTSTNLDTKSVTGGSSYDYTTSLTSGDVVHLEVQTTSANTVSYSITDNGSIGIQQTGRELSSYSKAMVDYTVN